MGQAWPHDNDARNVAQGATAEEVATRAWRARPRW
jgi:hypothetical protein